MIIYLCYFWDKHRTMHTGETIKIDFVQFDDFNKAGKIEREIIYGDFSKMVKE